MVKPFKLAWPVGHSDSMNKEDIENTKRALDALGLYDPPKLFTERFSNEPMIRGLKEFQRREGLAPDGVMKPGGPTHTALNRALAVGSQDEQTAVPHNGLDGTSFGPERENPFGASYSSGTTEQENKDINSSSEASDRREKQVAFAPAAIAFPVWLMYAIGAATVAAAMATYNSWDKKRQKAARDAYESETSAHDPGDYDLCHKRWEQERRRCGLRPPLWQRDCRDRARYRQNLCYGNGGTPNPGEPPEWSDLDEEVSPPR